MAELPHGRTLEITAAELRECEAHPNLLIFERDYGGVLFEIAGFVYCIIALYVLIEDYYVEALELMCGVLRIPKALAGATLMAAGNCLPELSISLIAVLFSSAPDIGTGEVFGSCVFDLLAVLGVVCVLLPRDGVRLPLPLILYFAAWVAAGTAVDALLFQVDTYTTWPTAAAMVALYAAFVGGAFVLHKCAELGDVPPQPERAALAAACAAVGTAATAAATPAAAPGGKRGPTESSPLLAAGGATPVSSTRVELAPASPLGVVVGSRAADEEEARNSPPAADAADGADGAAAPPPPGWWHAAEGAALAPARLLYRYTVPKAAGAGRMRIWPLTIVACVMYTLLLSFTMVHIASRSVCLLGVRKNALGATVLSLAAGLPDLISVVVLCGRPGMEQMAASNAFGAYAFNAFVALGLPWTVLGLYSDVFPPARGTWYPAAVGFVCVAIALAALAGCRFRMHRPLGGGLLLLYVAYLVLVTQDGLQRMRRPPE